MSAPRSIGFATACGSRVGVALRVYNEGMARDDGGFTDAFTDEDEVTLHMAGRE